MKRPPAAPWQLEKQRIAKGLLEMPLCEQCGLKRGLGFGVDGLWLCTDCARAQRERRT